MLYLRLFWVCVSPRVGKLKISEKQGGRQLATPATKSPDFQVKSRTFSFFSWSRATKLKKDQLSSSIIKRNRIFFWLKVNKLGLLEGLFGHSSVFSGISFKIFNKKVLCFITNHSDFRIQIAGHSNFSATLIEPTSSFKFSSSSSNHQ